MKKRNEKGFFLSETMVVITVVAVVLLSVFKIFSSVYYGFTESEKYNTTTAINALANIQKYYESIGEIDTSSLSETNTYINLTNDAKYESDYYTRIKEEYNVTDVYLINLEFLFASDDTNNFYVMLRRYIKTLQNIEGVVLVVAVNENEFAYTKIIDFRNLDLVGNKEDEYGVYIPIGGEFIDPGYEGWSGETPYIEWENDVVVDTSKPGTYYLHYDFDGYLFRRKVVVGPVASSTYIENLFETNPDDNGLIKDNTIDGNIRYTGSTVKNYVEFNDETWRIVGVFEVTKSNGAKEKLMKIVRDASLGNMSWDSSASTINSGWGVNEWSQADLQTMLNTYYLGTGTTCTYCNGQNQSTCTNDCSSTVTPISSTYTNMIEEVKWNTGAVTYNSVIPVETAYEEERGTTTGKICTGGTYCNDTVERKTEWGGKVGLIYPSDYGYASTDTSCRANIYDYTNTPCKNSNWLHTGSFYWTLSPFARSSDASRVWGVRSSGYVDYYNAHYTDGVRPAVYLKSSVQIIDGDGGSGNPYKLSAQ